MSLNCKEIDLVLSELDLEGAHIEKIVQPSYDTVVLSLFREGRATPLLISVAQGACRIHRLSHEAPKTEKPLRFQECLKSRIRGGVIESLRQLGDERVLRMDIAVTRGDEAGSETVYKTIGSLAKPSLAEKPEERQQLHYRLYARLWSGSGGNIILADQDGLIVDALLRRPKRGEVSGEPCRIEEELAAAGVAAPAPGGGAASPAQTAGTVPAPAPRRKVRVFAVRELPAVDGPTASGIPGGSFNEKVEAAYAEAGGALSRERLIESARESFGKRERAATLRIAELEAKAAEFKGADRLRELGDILLANQGCAGQDPAQGRASNFINCDDFYHGGSVSIEIDPLRTVVENARDYYSKAKKASSGLADVELELKSARSSLEAERAELARIEALSDPLEMARALSKGGTKSSRGKRSYPGLYLERNGWTIIVGRSAKENDDLLRHYVKGADLWLHTRDYAGAYVFIKMRAGKTYPLDIMLDAGSLALYYSKGRENGSGELYYTQAKYLRRAKDGPLGLVLPTHEKNLHIVLDEERLRSLRELMGADSESL